MDDIDWSPYCVCRISEYAAMKAEIERLRQSVIEMRQLLDDFWKTCTEEHSSVEMFVLHRAAGHAIARAYDAVPEEAASD